MSLVSSLICWCDLLQLILRETRPQVDINHCLIHRSRRLGVGYFLLLGKELVMIRPVVRFPCLQWFLV